MDLSGLFATGVNIIDEITATAQATVQFYPWISDDDYGKPQYATAIPVDVILDLHQRLRRLDTGQDVLQVASFVIPRPVAANGASGRREPVDPRDKFVLPNGYFGPILAVKAPVSGSTGAPYFLEVYLG